MQLLLASRDTGWVPEAGALFDRFSYGDSSIFGPETLASVEASIPAVLQIRGGSLSKHVSYEIANYGNIWSWVVVALAAGFLPGMMYVRSPALFSIRALLFCAVWFLGVFAVTLIRDPEAIIVTSVGLLGLGLLGLSEVEEFRVIGSVSRTVVATSSLILALVMAATAGMLGARGWFSLRNAGITAERQAQAAVRNFETIAGDKRVFGSGDAAAIFANGAFKFHQAQVSQPLLSGWPVFSPSFEIRKRILGFPEDLYAGFLQPSANRAYVHETEQLFLGRAEDAAFTAGFMANQLGLKRRSVPVSLGRVNDSFSLWSFQEVTP